MENKTLCHEAIVKKVDDDKVTVQMHVESACATCHTRHLCGMSESKLEELVIHNFYHDHFEIGEKVQVEIKNTLAWKAIIICYFIPFIVLIVSLFTLTKVLEQELASVLISLGAVALYYFIVWLFRDKIEHNTQFVITKKSNINHVYSF